MAQIQYVVNSRFNVIDLSQLGRMVVLEDIDSEQNIIDRMLKFKAIWTEHDPPSGAQYDVENLEFDPIRICQEANAFFEVLLRDRINQAARAITLAFAISTDLDAIASRYPVGPRLDTDGDGEPDEADDRYRRRVQLSLNALSPHGVAGAYIYWALTADPFLRDASEVAREGTGEVIVSVMDELQPLDGETTEQYRERLLIAWEPRISTERLLAIRSYIYDEGRRGVTDVAIVANCKVVDTTYYVKVWFFPPPDRATLLALIRSKLLELVDKQRWLGYDHTRMAIDAAVAQMGVHHATIVSPAEDIFVDPTTCVRVSDITLEYMGTAE
jgi:phage-related baseplate assembly protein